MHTLFGTIPRRALMFVAMLVLAFGGFLATASPSSAATVDYRVNEAQTCRNQYGGPQYYAGNFNRSPYGWTCYYNTYGFPAAVTMNPVGGLDFQRFYCDRAYPGSRAVLAYYAANGWRCRYGGGGW